MKANKYHQKLAELVIPAVFFIPIPALFFNTPSTLFTRWCYDVTRIMRDHPSPRIRLLAAAIVLKYWHYDSSMPTVPAGGASPPGGAPKMLVGAEGPKDPHGHPLCTFDFRYLPLYADQFLEEIYRLLKRTLQVT